MNTPAPDMRPLAPSCHEKLRSFLGEGGVFLPSSALRATISEILESPAITRAHVAQISAHLAKDPFLPRAQRIDLSTPETLTHLSPPLLRAAILDLTTHCPDADSQRVLEALTSCLHHQRALERRGTTRVRLGIAAAAFLGLGALEMARRSEGEVSVPHPRSQLTPRSAPPSNDEGLTLPARKMIPKGALYVYDRSSREPLLEAFGSKPLEWSDPLDARYEFTLENGETKILSTTEAIVLTHEARAWLDGPIEVFDNETGTLVYRGEVAAVGLTYSDGVELCLSFYIPGTNALRPRVNVLDGRAFREVRIVGPKGPVDLEPLFNHLILDDLP